MVISNLTPDKIEEISSEVQILNSLDHPNIVKYYEIYEDSEYLYIVMENCTGINLYEKVTQSEKINEEKICKVAQNLLRAVNHCHSNGVIHRDIKLENIIVDKYDNPKLVDFGLSKSASASQILKSMAGTPYYMAPEIMGGKTYTNKVDLWSLGVVFYTMLCGYRPFDGSDKNEVFELVKAGEYQMGGKAWTKISPDARDLVQCLLKVDPSKRLSAKEALDHRWFGLVNEIRTESAMKSDQKIDAKTLERLLAYKDVPKLRKAVLSVLVKMLKPKEVLHVSELFKRLDKDQNGYIDADELSKALEVSDPSLSPKDAKNIINELDFAGNKKINYSEFLSACLDLKKILKDDDRTNALYNQFDTDGSGIIHQENIIKSLGVMGKDITQEEIDQFLLEYGEADGSGVVYENFQRFLLNIQ